MSTTSAPIGLIVGLGNPGGEHVETRHNVGFWFVDRVAADAGVNLRHETKFKGDVAKATISGHLVWLLKPMTYMNLSGQSVAALARFYKIEPECVLVAHDELDFAPGQVRLKSGGGAGGHNGLTDISARLGSKNYQRLRIGIGHPGSARQVSGYVLKRPSVDDRIEIETSIDKATQSLADIIDGRLADAMNRLHAGSPKPKKPKVAVQAKLGKDNQSGDSQ